MRTTIVSPSSLKKHKTVNITLIIAFNVIGFSFAFVPFVIHDRYYIWLFIPSVIFFSVRWYREIKNLRSMSYDDRSVYYEKDGIEVQIPFEKIKKIEMIGLNVFAIDLFRPAQDERRVWFKTSDMWPFNFKKQEKTVNLLRDKIDEYKQMT